MSQNSAVRSSTPSHTAASAATASPATAPTTPSVTSAPCATAAPVRRRRAARSRWRSWTTRGGALTDEEGEADKLAGDETPTAPAMPDCPGAGIVPARLAESEPRRYAAASPRSR